MPPPPLHPHSTTHSAATGSLPNLSHSASASSLRDASLCFDARELSAHADREFDAGAFIAACLGATNPAFTAEAERGPSPGTTAGDDWLDRMPAHAASPSVPLELLREHLTSYQLRVKAELVELLNSEYAAFIGLASSLAGVDQRITGATKAMHELQAAIETVQARVEKEATAFHSTLSARLAQTHKQSVLQALAHVLEQVRLCSKEINESDDSAGGRAAVVEQHIALASTKGADSTYARKSARTQVASNPYEGLRIDVPLWMLRSQAGLAVGRHSTHDDDSDEEADDDDEGDERTDEADDHAFSLYQALLRAPASTPSAADALASRLVRLERVSHSLASLKPLLDILSPFTVVRDLRAADGVSGSFDLLQARTSKQVRAALVDALKLLSESSADGADSQLRGLVRSVLRCFTFLDSSHAAEEIVREHLIAPVLAKSLNPSTLRAANVKEEAAYWTSRAQSRPLHAAFEQVLQFVRGPLALLLDCCDHSYPLLLSAAAPASPSSAPLSSLSFSFLTHAFLPELVASLSRDEVALLLFKTGLPHLFQDHYLTVRTFLQDIEEFALERSSSATDEAQIASLRAQSASFLSKWNLGFFYFPLRAREVSLKFEESASKVLSSATTASDGAECALVLEYIAAKRTADPLPAAGASHAIAASATLDPLSSTLHLAVSQQLWHSVLSCFHEHFYLDELGASFLRLAIQCVTRFAKIVEEVLAKEPSAGVLLLLHADCHRLESLLLPQWFIPFVLGQLGSDSTNAQIQSALTRARAGKDEQKAGDAEESADDEVLQLVSRAFAPSLTRLHQLQAASLSRLVESCSARCRECVSELKSFSLAYRGQRRKIPTNPLRFVRASLAPLAALLTQIDSGQLRAEAPKSSGEERMADWRAEDTESVSSHSLAPSTHRSFLTASDRDSLRREVLSRLVSDFDTKAKDCLADLSRLEEASKRLGARASTAAAAAAAGGADLTDSDNTRRWIDINAKHFVALAKAQLGAEGVDDIAKPLLQAAKK